MIFALGVIAKSSIILICAGIASAALRHSSASVRHALWAAALGASCSCCWRILSLANSTGCACREYRASGSYLLKA
jgi:hypothetical protein